MTQKTKPSFDLERKIIKTGFFKVAGIDEAGRGPLAGPVVAAAVILDPDDLIDGINDSKLLTEKRREILYKEIMARATDVAISIVSHEEICYSNILLATLLAMRQAVIKLNNEPDFLLIDGNKSIAIAIPQNTIINGDKKCVSISAASIIAKVTRDQLMRDYDKQYPGYGFAKHKGYGTKFHKEKIKELGPCDIHRVSFRGVKEFC